MLRLRLSAYPCLILALSLLTPRASILASPADYLQDNTRRVADTISASERTRIRQIEAQVLADLERRRRADSTRTTALRNSAMPTAFADAPARALLERARAARVVQDSALLSYSAEATQRFTVRASLGRMGPSKLITQGDNVALIEWKHGAGARITPIGSRVTSSFDSDIKDHVVGALSLPYFPGREQLWIPTSQGVVRTDIDERQLIHPIARGAEAYYHYETGDSISIRLPDGRTISIRELRISARKPEWRAFVGSFWFDVASGHLVRAAYRLAADIEMGQMSAVKPDTQVTREYTRLRDSAMRVNLPPDLVARDSAFRANGKDVAPKIPALVKLLIPPSRARIQLITTEYGLYEGRFWLPRLNSMEAMADVGMFRMPIRMDEKYSYNHVNGALELPPVAAVASVPITRRCTEVMVGASVCDAPIDSATRAQERLRAQGDSVVRCATDSVFTSTTMIAGNTVPLAYRMPCKSASLRVSPRLPEPDSSSDDLFSSSGRDHLLQLLGMGLQAGWSPQSPTVHTGLDMARYNRVEGFSLGLRADQRLGSGYAVSAMGRIGHADLHANGELSIARTNGRRTLRLTAYHRLSAVNPEWTGEPSFRTSLPAFLYARDEAFYMRAAGFELSDQLDLQLGALQLRLFAEREWTAGDSSVPETFALFGPDFPLNIVAQRASAAGIGATLFRTLSSGLRHSLNVSLRGEGATGTFDYGKSALEITGTRSFGPIATSASVSGGLSAGTVPTQRQWYLGGLRTVRGQLPGTQSGNSFWLARTEVGLANPKVRPVLFFDAGWAGNRDVFSKGELLRGAGGGLSFLDGLVRADLARGLGARKAWRFDIYLQAPL